MLTYIEVSDKFDSARKSGVSTAELKVWAELRHLYQYKAIELGTDPESLEEDVRSKIVNKALKEHRETFKDIVRYLHEEGKNSQDKGVLFQTQRASEEERIIKVLESLSPKELTVEEIEREIHTIKFSEDVTEWKQGDWAKRLKSVKGMSIASAFVILKRLGMLCLALTAAACSPTKEAPATIVRTVPIYVVQSCDCTFVNYGELTCNVEVSN